MTAELVRLLDADVKLLSLPVHWQDSPKDTPSIDHVRAKIMLIKPRQLAVCGRGAKEVILFQVSVYHRAGQGLVKLLNAAELYANMYATGDKIGGYTCIEQSEISSPFGVDGWFVQAVTYRFSKLS